MSEDNPIATPASLFSGERLLRAALALAVIALAATAWQWLDQRQHSARLEKILTERLADFDGRNRDTQVRARHAEESTQQSGARLALLEQKLEEAHTQQEALQTLYAELASNRDAWAITEAEQLAIIANQQLQLAGNVKPALLALQTADNRLQQLDKPQVIPLRKVLGKDIQKLQALPGVDVVGMNLKLESLVDASDKLALVSERHPKTDAMIKPDFDTNPWRRLTQEVWQDVKRMVRIERMDHPEPPVLAPEQVYFLRENLKLHLLAARIALLQHDEATYRVDLHTAELWIKRYFDPHDTATTNALTLLQQLSSSSITIQLPDISESLNAIAKYKLTLERNK